MKKTVLPVILSVLFSSHVLADTVQLFYGSEVLVTASRRLELRRDSFASNRVLYENDIRKTGAKTVADALRSVTDIYIKSTGGLGGISMIKLKGTASEQVLILVDGARINSNLLGLTDMGDIPIDIVDRIEVVDESLSSIYGADAVGGAINVITKKNSVTPVFTNVGYGSFNTLNCSAGTAGKAGPVGYLLAFGTIRSDGFRQNGDYNSRNVLLNTGINDVFGVKYASSYSERGNPGVPASDTDPYSASLPSDRQSDLTKNLSLKVNPRVTDNTKMDLEVFENTSFERVHYQDSSSGTFVDEEYASRTTGASFQTVTDLGRHILTTGLETRRDNGESPKAGSHTIENNSAYLNAELGAGAPLSVNAGARIDNNSVWGSVVNPRIGAKLRIEDTIIKMSVSQAFRAPTINELYWNEPWTFGGGMFGNAALLPEKSLSVNISADRDMGWASLSCNYYLNRISNMIKWEQSVGYSWAAVNINSAKVEGVVVEAKSRITDNAVLKLGYNLEQAIDIATGKTITYNPEQKFNARLEAGLWGATANINVRSVSQVYTDTLNTKTLPAYTVADTVIGWSIAGASISLGAYNVFDEKYYESVGYSSVDWKERGYPMPGRRFEVSVKI